MIKNAITVQNFCRVITLLKTTMDNPFLALFENSPPPKKSDSPTPTPKAEPKPPTPTKTDLTTGASRLQHVNQIIENSFLFTINPYGLLGRKANDPVKSLLFLQVCSCQSFTRNISKHIKSPEIMLYWIRGLCEEANFHSFIFEKTEFWRKNCSFWNGSHAIYL